MMKRGRKYRAAASYTSSIAVANNFKVISEAKTACPR